MTALWGVLAASLVALASVQGTPAAAAPSDWIRLASETSQDLAAVSFPDVNNGHVVGSDGTILATSDGGVRWVVQAACSRPGPCAADSGDRLRADLAGVAFPDPSHGFVVGARGAILATTDGGRTWPVQAACSGPGPCRADAPDRVTADLSAVVFSDPSHGFAVGARGTILATTDGGRTWAVQRACEESSPCLAGSGDLVVDDLAGVSFADSTYGYAVGARGTILATRNGGRTWAPWAACRSSLNCLRSSPDRISADLRAVSAPDPSHAYAVGSRGTVLTTTDGRVWTARATCARRFPCAPDDAEAVTSNVTGIALSDRLHGQLVGAGGLLSALGGPAPEDGERSILDGADFAAVALPDANTRYAVGRGGVIAKRVTVPEGLRVAEVGPDRALTSGGTPVVIRGTGFTGASTVTFGRLSTTKLEVRSDTEIVAIAPPHPAGRVHVSVATPKGVSPASDKDQFRYTEPVGGRWEPTASCAVACRSGPAVLLHNGQVLAVGSGALLAGIVHPATALAELYDPVSGSWSPTGSLAEPRIGPTATLLSDGRVLVAGGISADQVPLDTAELYDPASRAWTPAGRMATPRSLHTAVLLADGRVLVAGGSAGDQRETPSADIFDPASGRWAPAGRMHANRSFHTATLLADHRVLVVGGYSAAADAATSTAEIYDPATGAWTETAAPPVAHAVHTATLLKSGRVLVVGGLTFGQASREVEIYDPVVGSWESGPAMVVARALHSATLLDDGRVLVAGGSLDAGAGPVLPFVEMYDPGPNRWTMASSIPSPRDYHSATLLDRRPCGQNCGKVLVAGGADCRMCFDATVPSAQLFSRSHPGIAPADGGRDSTVPSAVRWATPAVLLALAVAFVYLRRTRTKGR